MASAAKRGNLTLGVAATAIAALVFTSLAWISTRSDLRRTREAVAQLHERLEAMARRLSVQEASNLSLREEVSELRAVQESQPDLKQVAERVLESVFTVEVGGSRGSPDQGSAFVFRSTNGRSTLLTSFHVVRAAVEGDLPIRVRIGEETHRAAIRTVSRTRDLASLIMRAEFPALRRTSEKISVGETVMVVGSPLGFEGTVATGVYSGKQGRLLQFSAPVSPGSSGGPVVNERGEVIGIAAGKAQGKGAEGISFAVPINAACLTVVSC